MSHIFHQAWGKAKIHVTHKIHSMLFPCLAHSSVIGLGHELQTPCKGFFFLKIRIRFLFLTNTKGQLISKCPFGQKTSPKKSTKNFSISALKFFVASLELPGSFWGLSLGFLMYDITYYVLRNPKKLQGSLQEATKKFQGRNREIFR